MTKADFVKQVAQRSGLTGVDAAKAVKAFWEVVEDSLGKGEDVQFSGHGKFSVSARAARQGVNPRQPGTRIQIPARKVPKFTAGTLLKRAADAPPPKKAAAKTAAKKKK